NSRCSGSPPEIRLMSVHRVLGKDGDLFRSGFTDGTYTFSALLQLLNARSALARATEAGEESRRPASPRLTERAETGFSSPSSSPRSNHARGPSLGPIGA